MTSNVIAKVNVASKVNVVQRDDGCYSWRHEGECAKGSDCKWKHVADEKGVGRICAYHRATGQCRFGSNCRFAHLGSQSASPAKLVEGEEKKDVVTSATPAAKVNPPLNMNVNDIHFRVV